MECPNNHKDPLQQALFHNVEVDYCRECLGMWFDYGEFENAKADADEQLNWMDFDVWRDKSKFSVIRKDKHCPSCRTPFVEIGYDDSSVKVDFCKHCRGIWLDRGEFKQIMVYLRKKSDYEILHRYTQNAARQLWEVFAGPEDFRDELADFLMLVKLFKYKFITQHPRIEALIEELPK